MKSLTGDVKPLTAGAPVRENEREVGYRALCLFYLFMLITDTAHLAYVRMVCDDIS